MRSPADGVAPGQGLEPAQDRGLVAFDDEQVVAAGGDDVVGVVVLGVQVQGVGGDDRAGQVQVAQQGCEGGDLVALGLDLALGQDGLGVVADGGQEVDRAARGTAAAQGLAVHGQAGQGCSGVCRRLGRLAGCQRGKVAAGRGVEGVAVQTGEQSSQGGGGRSRGGREAESGAPVGVVPGDEPGDLHQ